MEDFFKQPMLERLYDSISEEFEKSILEDNCENKKYYDLKEEEEKLQSMMIEIIGNEPEKITKLMEIIREIEYYCCKETDYWNKKYFKLGFSYVLQLTSISDKSIGSITIKKKENEFSSKVHNFLDNIRLKKISDNQKKELLKVVKDLEKGSDLQKERFIKFYDLNCENKIYKLSELSIKEGCSSAAIRSCVIRISAILAQSKEDKKEYLQKIIDNNI